MDRNIEELQVASALVAFDNSLRSAANTVTYFGVVFGVLGIIFTFRFGLASSLGALAIGAALLCESFYIRRTRSTKALWVAGISFAVFAAWLLGSFIIGVARKDSSLGNGVIAGAFLAFGAWNLLRSYSAYKALLERANPAVNQYVRDAINQMRTADPSQHLHIVEFKKRGLGEKGTWRLRPDGNRFLICQFADKTFGLGGTPQLATYISRHDIQIQREGDRWLGQDVNANLFIGGVEQKIRLKPDMLTCLESILTSADGAVTTAK